MKDVDDFHNFIRNDVLSLEKKDHLIQQRVMSNKKSSTATDDEKEKATNLYNALVYDQKSIFYATDRVTKH